MVKPRAAKRLLEEVLQPSTQANASRQSCSSKYSNVASTSRPPTPLPRASGAVINQNIAPHRRLSGRTNTLGTIAPTSRPLRSATRVCGGGEKKALSSREKACPARDL